MVAKSILGRMPAALIVQSAALQVYTDHNTPRLTFRQEFRVSASWARLPERLYLCRFRLLHFIPAFDVGYGEH